MIGLLRESTHNQVPSDVAQLTKLMKTLPIRIERLAPIERAISTAGGVAMSAIDDNFMLSTHPDTYVIGEMLDWDAPTGGYLLQACFSMGRRAGSAAAARSLA